MTRCISAVQFFIYFHATRSSSCEAGDPPQTQLNTSANGQSNGNTWKTLLQHSSFADLILGLDCFSPVCFLFHWCHVCPLLMSSRWSHMLCCSDWLLWVFGKCFPHVKVVNTLPFFPSFLFPSLPPSFSKEHRTKTVKKFKFKHNAITMWETLMFSSERSLGFLTSWQAPMT